jgi:glycosyltransferase involved in cell wall biosynthesis
MPCLNEAETLGACVGKARAYLERRRLRGEVLVADNGSTDGSREIARAHGARVVEVEEKGYGAALRGGIEAARGRYIVMGDADDSYDFSDLDGFLARLREGHDLVMGNRFQGGIRPGAMPWKNRWIGNPVLSSAGRLLYSSPIGDFHCGLRGFARDPIRALGLRPRGWSSPRRWWCRRRCTASPSPRCRRPSRGTGGRARRTCGRGATAGGTSASC